MSDGESNQQESKEKTPSTTAEKALKEQANKISKRYKKIKEEGKTFFKNADINFQLTAKTTALISIYPYMYNLKEFINEPPSIEQNKLDLTHILPIMSYLYQIYILIDIIEKKALKNGIFFTLEDHLSFQKRIEKIYEDLPGFITKIMNNLNSDLKQLKEKINFMDANFVQYFNEKLKSKIESIKNKLGDIVNKNDKSAKNEINSDNSPNISVEIKSVNDFLMEAKSMNNEIENVMNEIKKHDIEQTGKYNAYKKYLSFLTERIVSINVMITNYQLYEETLPKIVEVDKYVEKFKGILSQELKKIQINDDPWPFIAIINSLYLTEPENLYDDKILLIYDCQLKLLPFKELFEKKVSSKTEGSSKTDGIAVWDKMKQNLEEIFEQKSIYEIMSILIKANIYNKPYDDKEIKAYNPYVNFDKFDI